MQENNNSNPDEIVEENNETEKEHNTEKDLEVKEENASVDQQTKEEEPEVVNEEKSDNASSDTAVETVKEENVTSAPEENRINCPFCSREIPGISNVCPYCGKRLVAKDSKTAVSGKTKIIAIAAAVLVVVGLLIAPAIRKNSTYRKAINNMKDGEYDKAVEAFTSLEGYKNADEYIVYCDALKQYENNDLEKAISRFKSISGLDDADNYVNYLTAIKSIQNDKDVETYESATELFNKSSNFLDSEEMAKYCQGIILFLNEDSSAVEKLQEVVQNNSINENYIDTASAAIRFIEAKNTFDKEDLSCIDEFKKLKDEQNGLVSSMARDYVYYIEGLEFYNQEMFYSAYKSLNNCYNFKDSSQMIESCHKERPASGIVYKNTSSSVSVTIYDTSDDEDMFVKIYDSNDNLIESLYIRDGASATARFQAGKIRMAIASGSSEDWFGPNEAFGAMGTYQRLLLDGNNEYFTFPGGGAYTLKFNVNNGNVNHKSSSYGDF